MATLQFGAPGALKVKVAVALRVLPFAGDTRVGATVATGEGVGDGFGEADGVGDGLGVAVGDGLGDGVTEGFGVIVGVGEGDALGNTLGDGLGVGLGSTQPRMLNARTGSANNANFFIARKIKYGGSPEN